MRDAATTTDTTTGLPYVLTHWAQWPEGTTTLSWTFDTGMFESFWREQHEEYGTGFDGTLPEAFHDTFRAAFDTWSGVAGIRFVEVPDGPDVDIRIGTGNLPNDIAGWGNLDDTGNGVVEAFVALDVGFLAEGWSPAAIYNIALHEVGHALGIEHSDIPGVVLSGLPATEYIVSYDLLGEIFPQALREDDIAAARDIFGPRTDPVEPRAVVGSEAGDLLFGGPGDDRIWGLAGNDTLLGQAGDDLVFGMDGADTLFGGAGDDTLLGGAGDDRLTAVFGDDRVWGEAGNDTLVGGDGDNLLAGGTGHDLIVAGTGGGYLWGEAGNDTLEGDVATRVQIAAGSGDDVLVGASGRTTFWGQEDHDFFRITGGVNWIMDYGARTGTYEWIEVDSVVHAPADLVPYAHQLGEHLLLDFGDTDVYLAWTTTEDLAAFS